MSRVPLGIAVAASLAALPAVSRADPIDGQISAVGYVNYDDAGNLTFTNPAGLGAGYGTFAGRGCPACATFDSFNFNTVSYPQELYRADLGAGVSTSFVLDSVTALTGDHTLQLNGLGTVTLSGYDPTPGTLILTAQDGGLMDVSFSATATATPEPASLAVLGTALVGLGMLRRKATRTA